MLTIDEAVGRVIVRHADGSADKPNQESPEACGGSSRIAPPQLRCDIHQRLHRVACWPHGIIHKRR